MNSDLRALASVRYFEMDLPSPPAQPPTPTRAPGSGLKWMLVTLLVFAALAGFGQWERLHRSQVETAKVIPTTQVSPAPSPNESGH